MKKDGYKANRPTTAELDQRYRESQRKAIEEIIERRRRVAKERAAKGLPPRVYKTQLPESEENQ